ncbi:MULTISPECIES: hypothetical protein [unclassified Variovorax]|uniref:hypothetical protein n=1 Tax=unclassified Variovorax TaxID=663243 RepID=UPI001BD39711|nr:MULTISPECIES: hypothetical protein [unclassified Variovorax]
MSHSQKRRLIKSIFENVQNLILCALLIAAGLFENANSTGLMGWIAVDRTLGIGLILAGFALAVLNLRVGLLQLAKLPFRRISMTLLSCVYVLGSARLITVMTAFRSVNS